MQKYRSEEIQPFTFSEFQSDNISDQSKFETFNFKNIEGEAYNDIKISEETIRQERSLASQHGFKIDGIVSESRGLSRQERNDIEIKINEEVTKRLKVAYQEAFQEGLEKGRAEGREESLAEFQQVISGKIEELSQIISEVQDQTTKVLARNQQDVYDFIKRFTKWIILKEINEKMYLENLLEKLILELNARKNIIIKVGKANFSQMPEVIATIEARMGQLSNVRVEIVPEINHPGIILEAENGLIDGTLEGVFKNIDKIFETVVQSE